MVWWISLAVVLAALVPMVLAVLGVLKRLPRLRSALVVAQERATPPEPLQRALAELQHELVGLQDGLAAVQARTGPPAGRHRG